MPPPLLAFDFDGTLADSLHCFVACLREASARHGFRRLEDDMVEEVRGLSGRQLMTWLGVPLWKVPAIAADMRRQMGTQASAIPLFPGMAAALRQLKANGVRLAIATSNSRQNVEAIVGPELAADIDHWSCGISLFGKAGRLRAIARRHGLSPAQLIYIGDEIRDAEAAREAGVRFRGVSWGYTRAEVLQRHCDAPLLSQAQDIVELAATR